MELIVQELESNEMLEEDNGRKVMWGEKREGIPLTIVKSDGGFTYDTSDMAALKQRIEEERADWVNPYFLPCKHCITVTLDKLSYIYNLCHFAVNIRDGCWSVFTFSYIRELRQKSGYPKEPP